MLQDSHCRRVDGLFEHHTYIEIDPVQPNSLDIRVWTLVNIMYSK